MTRFQITLEVEEETEAMAYQLLAVAVKKKYKSRIRPLSTKEWREIAGQSYDYTSSKKRRR